MLCSLKKSNNRVIPNLRAEGGQERDLTMRISLLGRKRDRVTEYGTPLVPPTASLKHDDVRSLSRPQADEFGMTIMVEEI